MNPQGLRPAPTGGRPPAPARLAEAPAAAAINPAPRPDTARVGQVFACSLGPGLVRAPTRPLALMLGNPLALGLPAAAPAPALPHWKQLEPDRARAFTGQVYDTAVVQRVYPHEVYSWEHDKTTSTLIDLAAHDGWEHSAVPPVQLAHSEAGVAMGRRVLHYAVVDGHHRLNAAAEASRKLGSPVGVPAMVTARWEPNAAGHFVGYGRMPFSRHDAALPAHWNPSGQAQAIQVREHISQDTAWGIRQLTVTLPGARLDSSLADVAQLLNAFQRPDEFLDPAKGDTLRVRVSLQDVFGRLDAHSRLGDLKQDLEFHGAAAAGNDWQQLLQDTRPLSALFRSDVASQYPILQIQVQHTDIPFQSLGW